ncbi:hypothetical protein SD70_12555 [Gordoniibacillus kamchatkensis]|uniref:Uncharacterized protein n=1 Tax=Gordoniibacillus kamchatkensis TaxID=1590651 RepID=A0ABR5AHP6_9BACL|nr:HAD family hydrolase [Paenibacillus sp. VKM B-2647]KIL40574.1 hypothetical protein SD70_12555 [Paenibacillus sp. VKM B-2647]
MTNILYDQTELWKYDRFLSPLQPVLDSYRVVSFDIFDTVLLRACGEPADIFEKTAAKARKLHALYKPLSETEFRSLRIAAERSARRKAEAASGHKEVTLRDIYEELPASLLDREKVRLLELEAENETVYLNPNILSLLRHCRAAGQQIALVSDMYLSSAQMTGLLAAAGLEPEWTDLLLVSSEHGCSKVDGGLFDKLLQAFPGIQPHQIVHIGDNWDADVAGAARRGIYAVHYGAIPETFDSPYHWEAVRHGVVLPEMKSLRKLASCTLPAGALDERAAAFYRFGAEIVGPFLNALCEWAVDTCVEEGYSAVHPLMREAHILAPLLRRVIARRGLDIRVYPISISRQAAYLPSLQQFGAAELDYLLSQLWVKVKDIFEILQIEDEIGPFHDVAGQSIRDCKAQLDERGVAVADKLRQYLLSEPVTGKIMSAIEAQRALLAEYLQHSCGADATIVTLDIGFNGTIQHSLQKAAKLAGLPVRMVHLLAAGTERLADLRLQGMDIRCYIGSPGPTGDIAKRMARSPGFVEELMMGRDGSAMKYVRGDDRTVTPVCAGLHLNEEDFKAKEACQLGMLTFQSLYAFIAQVKPDCIPDPAAHRREWSLPLHRAIDMPTPAEAEMLGSLTHQDNFCGTQIARICEPVDDKWFSRGAAHFLDVCNYGPSLFNAFWPQGLLTQKEPYSLYRMRLREQDQYGRAALIFDMMCRLKAAGAQRFIVYGAGELAEQVRRAALLHGLHAEPASDPESLREAANGDIHVYVTATLNEFDSYRSAIEHAYRQLRSEVKPVVLSFQD